MKKIFIMLVTVSFTYCTALAQDTPKLSSVIKDAFNREFSDASILDWKKIDKSQVYRLLFKKDNTVCSAFFDEDGKLIATSRIIPVSAAPLSVNKCLTSDYRKFSVIEITEFYDNSQTSYLVDMENAVTIQSVRIYINGDSVVVRKNKKKFSDSVTFSKD